MCPPESPEGGRPPSSRASSLSSELWMPVLAEGSLGPPDVQEGLPPRAGRWGQSSWTILVGVSSSHDFLL